MVGQVPLNHDAFDTLSTLIVTAGKGPRSGDVVDRATMRASQSFP